MDFSQLLNNWYVFLSGLNSALSEPIRALSNGIGIPVLSALLFGILGTTAPCQLSTNFGALAFLARNPAERSATLRATLAYVAAKMIVYTAIGAIILTLGQGLVNAAGPLMEWARKLIGPAMIVMGLAVLGVIRLRFQLGQRLAHGLEQRVKLADSPVGKREIKPRAALAPITRAALAGAGAGATGVVPFRSGTGASEAVAAKVGNIGSHAPSARSGFLLGAAFSLAFCPTLALLFFGVTMTLAARSAGGVAFPAFFAAGTSLPLLILVGFTLTGAGAVKRVRQGMRRANKPLRWIAGLALLLLGLHDTVIYWFL